VSIGTDEDVIGLDVPVDVVHFVHFVDGDDEFSDVEPGLEFGKDIFVDEESEQVASRHPFHGDVEVVLVLEGGLELDQPPAPVARQALALQENASHLLLPRQLALRHPLYRHHLA
jgi:hypothetical protein